MMRSASALIGLVIIDALIVLGPAWMAWQIRMGAWHSPDSAISTITSTAGGAIGIVTALLLMASLVHRRQGN